MEREILKKAAAFCSFLKGIKKFQKIAESRVTNSFLVYAGDEEINIQGIQLINFRNSYQIV